MEIGFSIGSNLGDRIQNLKQARLHIAGIPGVEIVASSSVYETEPVDVPAEFSGVPFLNTVLIAGLNTSVESLYRETCGIEKMMGRRRDGNRNTPRPIDIDIIFAGDAFIRTIDLHVPHPRWSQRRFVVEPLAEIRPDLHIPGESRTVRDVLLALPVKPKVVLFSSNW